MNQKLLARCKRMSQGLTDAQLANGELDKLLNEFRELPWYKVRESHLTEIRGLKSRLERLDKAEE